MEVVVKLVFGADGFLWVGERRIGKVLRDQGDWSADLDDGTAAPWFRYRRDLRAWLDAYAFISRGR